MWYVDCRSELRTQWVLSDLIQSGKSIVVPFCTTGAAGENCLGLWRIECLEELVVGKWKILEPPESSWFEPERVVKAMELDFVVVPGVAFTRNGSRLGNGQGYYDRLLSTVGPDCTLAGLCFECQIVDDAEMVSEPHDVSMHMIATEKELYLSTS
jgi:5-formyltetrahydrofolate cyclo-ligase